MKALRTILAWALGFISVAWRFSCRIEHHSDTRQPFFEEKQPFIIALLHAHMISALLSSSFHSAVMTSRSKDGDLIEPSVRLSGSKPVRGSSRKNGTSKGGSEALAEMLHADVRTKIWGYAKGERFSNDQLINEEYMSKKGSLFHPYDFLSSFRAETK